MATFRRWLGGFRWAYLPVLLRYLCYGASVITGIALHYFEKNTLGLIPAQAAGIASRFRRSAGWPRCWAASPWASRGRAGGALGAAWRVRRRDGRACPHHRERRVHSTVADAPPRATHFRHDHHRATQPARPKPRRGSVRSNAVTRDHRRPASAGHETTRPGPAFLVTRPWIGTDQRRRGSSP
jgi:hypothetical protein